MTTVDDYLAAQPAANRKALARVRKIILKTLPGVTDQISYQIIGFRYEKKLVVHISGWKDHLSFHGFSVLLGNDLVAKYPDLLKVKGRTLHFQPTPELPEALIQDLVLARVAELGL